MNLVKSETEEESEGVWHIFHYEGMNDKGKKKKIAVAVLEKDGKYLVEDVDYLEFR